MGNNHNNASSSSFESKNKRLRSTSKMSNSEDYTPVEKFDFMEPLGIAEDDETNGLCFNGTYLPEEILLNILSYIPPQNLLALTLVCKTWCNMIKSEPLWMEVHKKRNPSSPRKKLPWYIYYCYHTTDSFKNMLKNGNGQEKFKHWKIISDEGDQFQIENPPKGSDPLPKDVPDFNGKTSCFVTSFYECNKVQEISLKEKRLLRYILNKFMPHIYVSEWMAGRFDCGCVYKLGIRGYNDQYYNYTYEELQSEDTRLRPLFQMSKKVLIDQWQGRAWQKVEILIEEYPKNVAVLVFEHEGQDTQFWKGHYGSKMSGGVVRVVFESIEPLGGTLKETNLRRLYRSDDMDV
ncbi:unnamed protein product [Acanthoscelides obtectus]|uniref:Uncharacterized protein n=1 Tax=Acanthoscelides obtectus TaxID=200917 RepID=A0A9P0PDJ9_ACAOB|nr:unnamed protein product [Acanthoscelides obtectus]CAK1657341.1 F-box only protein 6 [Acanthoscelides obtectus]